jgi:hypothetical protein
MLHNHDGDLRPFRFDDYPFVGDRFAHEFYFIACKIRTFSLRNETQGEKTYVFGEPSVKIKTFSV